MSLHGRLHGLDDTQGGGSGGGGEVLSPAALAAGETDDYNPTDFSPAIGTLRLTPDSSGSVLTGLLGQPDRTIPLLLVNLSATAPLTLKSNSSASAAGNRFVSPNNADMTIRPGGSLSLWHDPTSLAWRTQATTPAPQGGVLWEWDGVGTSQFSGTIWKPTIGGSGMSGAAALSVVAGSEGNRLRLESVGAAQFGALFCPLAAGQLADIPEGPFRIQYEIMDGTVNSNAYAGVCFLTNGHAAAALADVFGIFQMQTCSGGWSYQGHVSAGAVGLSGSTPSGFTIPGSLEMSVRWNKPGGAQPRGFIQGFARGGQTSGTIGYLLSSARFVQPFPAGWNALTAANMGQFGLWFLANTPLASPFVEFGAIRVLSGS